MTDALLATPPLRPTKSARVSFVHDFMVERGGAERVLLELNHTFPGAEIHTAMFDPDGTYESLSELKVHALLGRRQTFFSSEHRRSMPLAVHAFRNATIDSDVLIANSSGLSHLAHSTGLRIVYCQTPARWLHRTDDYLRRLPTASTRLFSLAIRRWLLDVDREAIRTADALLVNSRHMAKVVAAIYGVESEVVIPPSSLSVDGPTHPIPDLDPGFFLTPSRLLSYKRVDVLLRAAEALPQARFLIIGDGPMRRSLRRMAPPNVIFCGSVPEATLRWAYDACHAVVLTCADDYGLVPREAAAFGKVAVVPMAGGYLEQSADGVGTITYPYGSWEALHGTLGPLSTETRPPFLTVCDLDADRNMFRSHIATIVDRTLGGPP
ncbi:MAG: glycosyltransferase [Acidimicrobiia bacterium]|nr:glycosyltransferase [Acidimicrobiia bacterium]